MQRQLKEQSRLSNKELRCPNKCGSHLKYTLDVKCTHVDRLECN